MPEPKRLPMSLRGDGPCSRCGTHDNPVWSTSSVLWNEVVRSAPLPWMADTDIPDGDGLMCVNCFIRLVKERGYAPDGERRTRRHA